MAETTSRSSRSIDDGTGETPRDIGDGENETGNEAGGSAFVDPAEIDAERAGEKSGNAREGKRGRGRPRKEGSRRETKKEHAVHVESNKPVDQDTLSASLYFTHEIFAKVSRTPEWALEKPEADIFADSMMKVMRHYPNLQMAQKSMDWMNMMGCLSLLYGARFAAIKARKQKERAEKMKTANVG